MSELEPVRVGFLFSVILVHVPASLGYHLNHPGLDGCDETQGSIISEFLKIFSHQLDRHFVDEKVRFQSNFSMFTGPFANLGG